MGDLIKKVNQNKRETALTKSVELRYQTGFLLRGCVLALLGIAAPILIRESDFGIYKSMIRALDRGSEYLIIAALKLVLMNVLRMLPHYLGAFMINESLQVYVKGKRCFAFNVVFTFALIASIYVIIDQVFGIRYDLGSPAFLTVSFLLLFSYMDLFSVKMGQKISILGSLLMGIQWLDVMPRLSAYGFGRGEISMDVKMFALVMDEEGILTLFAVCMCAVFSYAFLMQSRLLYNEHLLKISNDKALCMEKELYESQLNALKMRNMTEVQSLVHDLKTPLTTVQGLVSLAEMMESNSLIREYFEKITVSLGNMNMMISEILYENKRVEITTADLMQIVLAHTSIIAPVDMVDYENECPEARLMGNRIRLSRAIMNLINNAYDAVDKEKGKIRIRVQRNIPCIEIVVEDNGVGIAPERLKTIWEIGYSGRHSTGLGLTFTKDVVEKHGGTIKISSEEGKYTRAVISLREEVETDE